VELPDTPGHENAGWVHELGSAATNVEVGDTVIVHPFISCRLCGACRAGDDMHCLNGSFPGINPDGGFAAFVLTSAGRWWLACGSGGNSRRRPRRRLLRQLHRRPAYARRCGYGTAIVYEYLRQGMEGGCRRFTLAVSTGNDAAMPL
jgi:NADPH:quinone reductase-like Zn-dependent oxidoreductase